MFYTNQIRVNDLYRIDGNVYVNKDDHVVTRMLNGTVLLLYRNGEISVYGLGFKDTPTFTNYICRYLQEEEEETTGCNNGVDDDGGSSSSSTNSDDDDNDSSSSSDDEKKKKTTKKKKKKQQTPKTKMKKNSISSSNVKQQQQQQQALTFTYNAQIKVEMTQLSNEYTLTIHLVACPHLQVGIISLTDQEDLQRQFLTKLETATAATKKKNIFFGLIRQMPTPVVSVFLNYCKPSSSSSKKKKSKKKQQHQQTAEQQQQYHVILNISPSGTSLKGPDHVVFRKLLSLTNAKYYYDSIQANQLWHQLEYLPSHSKCPLTLSTRDPATEMG